MSLTRKMLKAMGIEDEKIDQIIEAHAETVDGLKADVEKYKAEAKDLPNVKKQLDETEKELEAAKKDGWKEKHDAVKKELDDYKAEQTRKEAHAEKEKAVRAYLESKNIKEGNLTIAMRGLKAEIDAAELEDGKIKDTKAFDDLIAGELAGLVTTTTTKPAPNPANPIKNTGGAMTKEQILEIKDGAERRKAMMENPSLFGLDKN